MVIRYDAKSFVILRANPVWFPFTRTAMFMTWKTIDWFTDLKLNREFIQLLGGIAIIVGIAALCIPYFYNNKKVNDIFYEAEV